MNDIVFTSVCFGDSRYLEQQENLKASILAIYPDANLQFYYDRMPDASRSFEDSHYGFKVHAIQEAKKNFKKVVWLDPAMVLIDSNLNDMLKYPLAVVRDDGKLSPFISDQALNFYGLTREDIADWHLVGGSLYYFDFNSPVTEAIFNQWADSEKNNLFGGIGQEHTGNEREHRNDEALMSVAMYMNNVKPVLTHEVRYCIENNPMWIKRHFK